MTKQSKHSTYSTLTYNFYFCLCIEKKNSDEFDVICSRDDDEYLRKIPTISSKIHTVSLNERVILARSSTAPRLPRRPFSNRTVRHPANILAPAFR